MEAWIPPVGLLDFVVTPIRQVIERIPLHHFLTPQAGEVLDPDQVYKYLQNYAFTQGFCIVTTSYNKANTYIIFSCIHHSHFTCNWCKLDKYRIEGGNKHKKHTNI